MYLLFLLVRPTRLVAGRKGSCAARIVVAMVDPAFRCVQGFPFDSFRNITLRPICLSLVSGGVSFAVSVGVGSRFDGLPPAYHDEYSYLFQAETFLAGRVSFPSHEARAAVRPDARPERRPIRQPVLSGTGVWMAPFVAAGHPYWGHWLAGAICAVLMFWIGRELAGDGCGLIAGLLTALSPGMALFSNLLLAHHPTLVGLGVFILGCFRMMRDGRLAWGFVAGGAWPSRCSVAR